MAIAKARAEVFCTPEGGQFATIKNKSHRETHQLKNAGFRQWLMQEFHKAEGKPPQGHAVNNAIDTIAATARFQGKVMSAAVRVGTGDGATYVDLTGTSGGGHRFWKGQGCVCD